MRYHEDIFYPSDKEELIGLLEPIGVNDEHKAFIVPHMALGYIVLFPMIPILAIATVISRRMSAKTGNIWLGAFINTMLFTLITCTNTAASFAYVMG